MTTTKTQNLTTTAALESGITLPTPTTTTTTTTAVVAWTLHLGPVKATITYDDYEAQNWSAIIVDPTAAESLDPELAALATQERNLGDDRWLTTGIDPEVDDLYARLNAQIIKVNQAAAVAVLTMLADTQFDKRPLIDTDSKLLSKIEFDRNAGCSACPCTPGVKAPHVRRHGLFAPTSNFVLRRYVTSATVEA